MEAQSSIEHDLRPRSRWLRAFDALLIALPLGLYVYYATAVFWMYPKTTDPVNYMWPVQSRLMTNVHYPDRLTVSLGMFLSSTLSRPFEPDPTLRMGAIHPLAVNVLCLVAGAWYCYRRRGFAGGLIFMLLLSTSFIYIRYSNDAYPDLDMSLWSLFAGIGLMSRTDGRMGRWPEVLCGVCCAFVALSKATALATLLAVLIFIFVMRRSLLRVVLGGLLGLVLISALTAAAFEWSSIVEYVRSLFDRTQSLLDTNFSGRYGVDVSSFGAVFNLLYLPSLAGLLLLSAFWKIREACFWLAAALIHVLLLAVVVAASGTLRVDNSVYYHTATTLACVGLAIGLAEFAGNRPESPLPDIVGPRLIGVLLIAAAAASTVYFHRHTDLVQGPTAKGTPEWYRWFFALVPIAMVALMLWVNVSARRAPTLLLLLLIAAWSPGYAAAWSAAKIERYQPWRAQNMQLAQHFNDAGPGRIGVLVSGVTEKDVWHAERMRSIFYNEEHLADRQTVRHLVDREQISDVDYLVTDLTAADLPSTISQPMTTWTCAGRTFNLLKLLGHRALGEPRPHPAVAQVMKSFHAYSHGRQSRAVSRSNADDTRFEVRIADADDVRIVTGPDRYSTPPSDAHYLAVEPFTVVEAALTIQASGGAEITQAYIVVLADGEARNMLPMELTRADDGTTRAAGTTGNLILDRPGFFRLMLYARGDGDIIVRDLTVTFATLETGG